MKREMAWEWNWPTTWPGSRHITVFSFDVDITRQGDHSPGFHVCFVMLNLRLLDFGYYNIYHEDETDD